MVMDGDSIEGEFAVLSAVKALKDVVDEVIARPKVLIFTAAIIVNFVIITTIEGII